MRETKIGETEEFEKTTLQKEQIIKRLKDHHCRITRQRLMMLDIILQEDCSCCKEIFFKVSKLDSGIGTATVYRMINTLEEIGAINRKNMYRILCDGNCQDKEKCVVKLDDNTEIRLSSDAWANIMFCGLRECGYITNQKLKSVVVKQQG